MKLRDLTPLNNDDMLMVRYVHESKDKKVTFTTYVCPLIELDETTLVEIDEYGTNNGIRDIKDFLDAEVKSYHTEECYYVDGTQAIPAVCYVLEGNDE